MVSQKSNQSFSGGRLAKRRKTSLACRFCRDKKIKCDGHRPICGTCMKRQRSVDECVWCHVDGREENSHSLLQSLQARIEQLERQSNSRQPSPTTLLEEHQSTRHHSTADQSVTPTGNPHHEVTALEGAVTGEPQSEGYVGSSSTAWFVSLIRRTIDPHSKSSPSNSTLSPLSNPQKEQEVTNGHTPQAYKLPSRQKADALVHLYWEFVHPLYPFVHKKAFESIYDSFWTSESAISTPANSLHVHEARNICTVYLVLALGCQYSRTWYGAGGSRAAEAHFTKARDYFRYDPIDSKDDSVQLIQVMLLLVQYLKGMGQTNKAWDIVGSALRIGQRLGLHIGTTTEDHKDPIERELIRRIWHGCLMSETQLCMTLGRPAMITNSTSEIVPLPIEVNEHLFQADHVSSESNVCDVADNSLLSFFVHSAKLYVIAQDVLVSFYADNHKHKTSSLDSYFVGSGSVFEIDSRLLLWYWCTPACIQLDHSKRVPVDREDADLRLWRQAVVLRLRYLQVRLYLLRPVLAKVCTEGRQWLFHQHDADTYELSAGAEPLVRRTAIQCSCVCIKAAIELIEVTHLHQTTAESWGQKPSWLFGTLHIYLAATVLLAARLAPIITSGEMLESKIQAAWENALQILRSFQSDSLSAQRCVAALEVLHQKLPGNRPQNDDTMKQRDGGFSAVPEMSDPPQVVPTGDDWTNNVQSWQIEGTEWIANFDFSDPYDMSWFQIAPELSFTWDSSLQQLYLPPG